MKYRTNHLKNVIFPLGGIGTGCIGLAGNGALVDWEIFNRPNKGSLNGYSHFAIKAEFPDGKSVAKVLQGDYLDNLIGKYEKSTGHYGYGYGPSSKTMSGFPHFKNVLFDGTFPIAKITFTDSDFPAKVTLTAFNPFIPLDADNSSIPSALFEINIKSFVDNVKYTVVLSVCNPFESSINTKIPHSQYTAVQMKSSTKKQTDKDYGDLTIATDCNHGPYQEYWYRGDWQDPVTTFWREFSDGTIDNRHFDSPGNADTCSVGANAIVNTSADKVFRFALSWNVPNNYNYWTPSKNENEDDILWKNYYATLFSDSVESGIYCLNNWNTLFKKTKRFCRSLHSCTLDKSVIDAISSTLSVLKTPTVLRLQDGTFYGWEGTAELTGSCEGTCTHVWSYAYALCFLFPNLEQSLRNTEFQYNTDINGRMYFRTALPLGSDHVIQPPCVDGQMATIIKIYRDWKLTGDSDWLRENWDNIKKVLEYAWNSHNDYEWDKDKDGVLEGRQHHTLDMELFGPSSWLQGMYLCALKAAAEIADYLGDENKKSEYTSIFKNGYEWTKENLFNGKYFFHKVDLQNKAYTEHFNCATYWNEEKGQLKYQIGDGCEIDQMLGQWHANICGLGDIFDRKQRKIALQNMVKNNFKRSLRNFTNMWRVFALNDEGGAVMCDYPEGCDKPIIPIPYCEECMTGFEYSFAGLLISEGFIAEGLDVVRAIRDRYDGEKRNPWNEIECGNNYARPMASFALLPIFSGFEFNMPKKHMGFSPVLSGDFKCMWNLGCAWGDFIVTENKYRITIADGNLDLKSIAIGNLNLVKRLRVDGKECSFTQSDNMIFLENTKAKKEILIEV
ncbi:MAG: GH116 family glycosyl hydrolase [bacterium]|nr:GH116 family glycosyl hydrolase [bacterium]